VSITVTISDPATFHFEANLGSVFGCGPQPTVSADVVQGPGGPNQWNANGFSILLDPGPAGGRISLNHNFEFRSFDGTGTPGCRPDVTWALTGGFTTNYSAYNGQMTISGGVNANSLITINHVSSAKGARG
jgi:hypothetical protein